MLTTLEFFLVLVGIVAVAVILILSCMGIVKLLDRTDTMPVSKRYKYRVLILTPPITIVASIFLATPAFASIIG